MKQKELSGGIEDECSAIVGSSHRKRAIKLLIDVYKNVLLNIKEDKCCISKTLKNINKSSTKKRRRWRLSKSPGRKCKEDFGGVKLRI